MDSYRDKAQRCWLPCSVSFVNDLGVGYIGLLTFVTVAARAMPGSDEDMADKRAKLISRNCDVERGRRASYSELKSYGSTYTATDPALCVVSPTFCVT